MFASRPHPSMASTRLTCVCTWPTVGGGDVSDVFRGESIDFVKPEPEKGAEAVPPLQLTLTFATPVVVASMEVVATARHAELRWCARAGDSVSDAKYAGTARGVAAESSTVSKPMFQVKLLFVLFFAGIPVLACLLRALRAGRCLQPAKGHASAAGLRSCSGFTLKSASCGVAHPRYRRHAKSCPTPGCKSWFCGCCLLQTKPRHGRRFRCCDWRPLPPRPRRVPWPPAPPVVAQQPPLSCRLAWRRLWPGADLEEVVARCHRLCKRCCRRLEQGADRVSGLLTELEPGLAVAAPARRHAWRLESRVRELPATALIQKKPRRLLLHPATLLPHHRPTRWPTSSGCSRPAWTCWKHASWLGLKRSKPGWSGWRGQRGDQCHRSLLV